MSMYFKVPKKYSLSLRYLLKLLIYGSNVYSLNILYFTSYFFLLTKIKKHLSKISSKTN